MPRSRNANSRPMLLITVATTASPGSLPSCLRCSAAISSTASPSTTVPAASTNKARSPSPSNAMPRRAPLVTTARARPARCVEPQSRLMLRPSGETPIGRTSKPSADRNAGAMAAVAPFAQSTTIGEPASGPAWSRICSRCARYGPDRSWRSITPGAAPTLHDKSATSVSTEASSASVSLTPDPPNTLMPLSSYGLCEAEITSPASNPSVRAR